MRVRDAEDSIYRDLRALAWRPYLTAMWLLCDELRSLYATQLSDTDKPLIDATMDLVRWREEPENPDLILANPDEYVDDASPMAQTLNRFASIVKKVTEEQGRQ